MLHSASYFETYNHRGVLIPVSRTMPRRLDYETEKNHELRKLVAPSRELLNWYKERQKFAISRNLTFPNHTIQAQYKNRYKNQIRPHIKKIKQILLDLAKSEQNYTILCWEKEKEFCHRRLLMMCVFVWHPPGCGEAN